MTVPKEEIERFLQTASLSNYQKISLPYGLEIPGKDHRKKIETVFRMDLAGKSVLDVGCYYGLYSHEARRRGAARVVGVELDPERHAIARTVAGFIDDGVEIRHGDIQDIELEGSFDIVIFLSVLHHVRDPVAVMRRLAELSADTVIVEFCTPRHRLRRKWQPAAKSLGWLERTRSRIRDAYRRSLLSLLDDQAGLIVTGDVFGDHNQRYDWTYFFNNQGFRTVFAVQNRFFSKIDFVPSPQKRNRMLAFCKVASPGAK